MPERFIDELNKTVQGVWDDLKPTETQGKKKGQPKALPVFSIHADGLVLSVETWKNPRRVLNPLCTLQHGEIAPFGVDQAVVSPAAISITAMAAGRSRSNCSGLDEAD